MEIVDISERYVPTYCKCLEEWSDEMKDSGTLKEKWYERAKGQGLRVKLAKNEKDEIAGMIQYMPSEHAPIEAESLYYVYCVWVHGHEEGVGNYQRKGIGKQLLIAAEEDAKALGAKGMAAWGLTLPFFMRSKWFKRNGYRHADKDGMIELVWKPFDDGAKPPRLMKRKKAPSFDKDGTTITCFRNGWCTAQNIAYERTKRISEELKDRLTFVDIDTSDRATMEEWGISDAIFLNQKQIRTGPPPSYEKLKRIIGKKIGNKA